MLSCASTALEGGGQPDSCGIRKRFRLRRSSNGLQPFRPHCIKQAQASTGCMLGCTTLTCMSFANILQERTSLWPPRGSTWQTSLTSSRCNQHFTFIPHSFGIFSHRYFIGKSATSAFRISKPFCTRSRLNKTLLNKTFFLYIFFIHKINLEGRSFEKSLLTWYWSFKVRREIATLQTG